MFRELNSKPASRRSLARTLILTYLALTLAITGLLTLVTHWVVKDLEEQLQYIDMGMAIKRIRNEYLAGIDPQRPTRFFHGPPHSSAIPDWLQDLEPGFYKRRHNQRMLHIIVDDYNGDRYILLRDYTSYEHQQVLTMSIVPLSLGSSLIAALALGLATSRRIVNPISALTAHIRQRQNLPPQTQLAAHYCTQDEINELAQAFDSAYNQLEQALQRERAFVADISHDLRTPLMVISTTCELLHDDPSLNPATTRQLNRIEHALQNLQQQFELYSLLARNQPAHAKLPMQDLPSLAKALYQTWQAQAQRQQTQLTLQLTESADSATAPHYPRALLRGLLNDLLRYQLHRTPRGAQITLHVGLTDVEITTEQSSYATHSQPGAGLSLARRICQKQGWRLSETCHDEGRRNCIYIDLSNA